MNNEIKRVKVWGGWLRLSHLLIGLSTLLLLATGKLIQNSPMLATNAADIHYYTAGFMAIGLLIRIVLMFAGQANEKIGNLLPKTSELRVIGETLRFYVLLGKAPLPRWYAQNPLWKPVYLAVYLILFLQIATGLLMPKELLFMGFYLPSTHLFWADLLLAFALLHIICVIWHDYKGGGSDVSAIINGVKIFTIDRPVSTKNGEQPIKFEPLKSPYSGKR